MMRGLGRVRSVAVVRQRCLRASLSSSSHYYEDRDRSQIYDRLNLDFLLHEVESTSKHVGDRDQLGALLNAAEDLVRSHPDADANADAQEPTWDGESVTLPESTRNFVAAYAESGFTRLGAAEEDGGLGLSFTEVTAVNSVVGCGVSSGAQGYYGLTGCAANLLREHGTKRQIDEYLEPMVDGRFMGATRGQGTRVM